MRADDTTLVAWSRTTTDIRRLASRANAMAPSMMTRASASEICAGVKGAGVGACARLVDAIVNNDRPAIDSARHTRKYLIVSSRRFWALNMIANVANVLRCNKHRRAEAQSGRDQIK